MAPAQTHQSDRDSHMYARIPYERVPASITGEVPGPLARGGRFLDPVCHSHRLLGGKTVTRIGGSPPHLSLPAYVDGQDQA